ncbi:hypothetical protein DEO72_LG9g295 [Vigna unguiculata]|uniref:Uncharacterized protein n=1 Tax=Vigna unguiculata TaxID=3917 RepID=A0A4D6MXC9_VIGUN|nr:hypothetical protein DEO72_LG9g295 [Vigna unguiculata]
MAESAKIVDLQLTLKPFYQRAAEAEERLSRLEATLNNKEDARNEENTKVINDLQSKLKAANAEIVSEKEKVVLIDVLFIYITFSKWFNIIPHY